MTHVLQLTTPDLKLILHALKQARSDYSITTREQNEYTFLIDKLQKLLLK
jgi:hypothetical protein